MVALLIGGESRLMDTLINKLNKDGHRVYLLTGRRDKKHKYPRVFERYDFTYDSERLTQIITGKMQEKILCVIQLISAIYWRLSPSAIRADFFICLLRKSLENLM